MGELWRGAICAKNVGTFHHQKSAGQISLGRCGERKARRERRCLAAGVAIKRRAGACCNAVTCVLVVYECAGKSGDWESYRGRIPEGRQAQ